MKKLILTGVTTVAALGLAACGYEKDEYNEQAGYNAEETNYTENAVDYGNEADTNYADNAADNATDNATGNAAVDNGY